MPKTIDKDTPLRELQVTVPSPMSSAEWAEVDPRVRLYSFFSARVEDEHLLDGLRKLCEQAMREGWTDAEFAYQARQWVDRCEDPLGGSREARNNMDPEERAKYDNDVRNLDSRARLELIIRTQRAIAAGLDQFLRGMTPQMLNAYPAWRFQRQAGAREKYKRPDHVAHENAVRLKTDFKFWLARNSKDQGGFEFPHAPFGFNSWMRLSPVARKEAERLGLIKPGERLKVSDEDKERYGISDDGSIPAPTVSVADISDEGKEAVKKDTEKEGGVVEPGDGGETWTPRLPDRVAPKPVSPPVEPSPAPAPQPEPVEPEPPAPQPGRKPAPARPPGVPEDVPEEDWLPWMLAKLAKKPKRENYKTEAEFNAALKRWRESLAG